MCICLRWITEIRYACSLIAPLLGLLSACHDPEIKNLVICERPRFDTMFALPAGLKGYFDYTQALSCARKLNKPLFIQFACHGCYSDRRGVQQFYSDGEIVGLLKKEFVIVHLYLDDKTTLPRADWIISASDTLRSIGRVNSFIERDQFKLNTAPLFLVVNGKGENMIQPFSPSEKEPAFPRLHAALKRYKNGE